jgi:1-acyl-sn-glycerol-3-phosphate acyltransferase
MTRLTWNCSRDAKAGRLDIEKQVWYGNEYIRALESVGIHFDVENLDAFRKLNDPCVFICNHMSTLETLVFSPIIEPYRPITYIVKESLTKYPVFKHIMNSQNPIVVTRKKPKEDLRTVLKEGKIRLDQGKSVVVFPQTTRSTSFDPAEFNTIGIKLASRSNAPIIPVALKTDAWGTRTHVLKEFGRIDPSKTVHICFGDPVHLNGNGKTEHQFIADYIAAKLQVWKQHEQAQIE